MAKANASIIYRTFLLMPKADAVLVYNAQWVCIATLPSMDAAKDFVDKRNGIWPNR